MPSDLTLPVVAAVVAFLGVMMLGRDFREDPRPTLFALRRRFYLWLADRASPGGTKE
jgi:hypothetical protein